MQEALHGQVLTCAWPPCGSGSGGRLSWDRRDTMAAFRSWGAFTWERPGHKEACVPDQGGVMETRAVPGEAAVLRTRM